jgi:hypothetical protein
MKLAPHRVQPCRDNSDAKPPFPKAVLATNEAASAVCGLLHRGQRGNQMTAQHNSRAESAIRHYTAKRMILVLHCFERFVSTRIGFMSGNNKRRNAASFGRHESFPRATESQLDSESSGHKDIDFTGLDFLKVARRNFGSFGQFVLRQFFTHPLAAHIRAEDFYPLPFFFGNSHDILHRF